MVTPFRFLTHEEFEKLDSKEKLKYLSEAMVELQRIRGAVPGWGDLFKPQDVQQPKADKDEPKDKPEP